MTVLETRFRRIVAAYLTRSGMSARQFGIRALERPGLASSLDRGHTPSLDTVDRVLRFMGEPPIGSWFRREVEACREAPYVVARRRERIDEAPGHSGLGQPTALMPAPSAGKRLSEKFGLGDQGELLPSRRRRSAQMRRMFSSDRRPSSSRPSIGGGFARSRNPARRSRTSSRAVRSRCVAARSLQLTLAPTASFPTTAACGAISRPQRVKPTARLERDRRRIGQRTGGRS